MIEIDTHQTTHQTNYSVQSKDFDMGAHIGETRVWGRGGYLAHNSEQNLEICEEKGVQIVISSFLWSQTIGLIMHYLG